MKLSTRSEYGIRVLVALAHADAAKPTSLAGIAQADKLPHAYIEQLVGALRRAGLVTATRGHSGGYSLARPAEQIMLVDAVRALDGLILEMPCAGPNDLETCDRPQDCSVHEVFERLHNSLSGMLGATTLADVAAGTGGPPYPPAVRRRNASAASRRSASASPPVSAN